MCTMVFLSSDKPFDFAPQKKDGVVALSRVDEKPRALADSLHVGKLVSWMSGRPTCSCVFLENSLPWEPQDEDADTIAAFDVLGALAEEHGSGLRILGCDCDEQDLEPNVRGRLAPEHIHAGITLFNIPFSGGAGLPHVMVEVVPGLETPEKPESFDVL